MTKTTPDVKEAYGKMKKEERVVDDEKSSDKPSPKKKSLPVKFKNVAFLEEHGDRFWFFNSHVIPGKTEFLFSFLYNNLGSIGFSYPCVFFFFFFFFIYM